MHKVILGVLLLGTNLAAMLNDADTWTVVSERLCAPFLEHGSTDDQLARTLRSLTKVVCTKLDAHREQKRTLFNNWVAQLCTDKRPLEGEEFHNQEQIAHKLWIDTDGTVSCSWGYSRVMFANQGSSFHQYQTWNSFIIPLSLRVGPSGNTVYALLARSAYNYDHAVPNIQYIDSVKFFLDDMGRIHKSDMRIMPGFFDKNLKLVTGEYGQLNCFTDTDQRRFCALALPYNSNENRESVGCVITGNAMGTYYAHQRSMFPFHAYVNVHRQPRLVFNDDSMSIIIDCMLGGSQSRYLDYACTKKGKELACKEHCVQLSDGTVLNMAELSVNSFTNLTAYLHNCPMVSEADLSVPLSPYADCSVVHTFVPSEHCPQKFFDTIIDAKRCFDQNKNTQSSDAIIRSWDTQKITDYTCAAILAGGIVEYHLPMLAKRFQEKRFSSSKLCFNAAGTVYYDAGAEGSIFLRRRKNLGIYYMHILHDWAKQIEPNVRFEETLEYLYAHASKMFTLHTAQLITSLERQAGQCAQHSWDNGSIGIAWSYTAKKDMRLILFDFTRPGKKKVGKYTIPGHVLIQGINSDVTDVAYIPQQKPTVWIDGKSFAV